MTALSTNSTHLGVGVSILVSSSRSAKYPLRSSMSSPPAIERMCENIISLKPISMPPHLIAYPSCLSLICAIYMHKSIVLVRQKLARRRKKQKWYRSTAGKKDSGLTRFQLIPRCDQLDQRL